MRCRMRDGSLLARSLGPLQATVPPHGRNMYVVHPCVSDPHGRRLPRSGGAGAVIEALRQIAGVGNVSTDPEELEEYGRDKWSHHSGTRPNVVVRARAVEQVQAVVRLCAAHRMPLIPYGSGTSLEGHTTAPEGGVVLDLSGMDDVLRVNHEDMDVVVQPGISYNELNARLKSFGQRVGRGRAGAGRGRGSGWSWTEGRAGGVRPPPPLQASSSQWTPVPAPASGAW